MKKRGFTLLELVIVMIIMGILATLGFSQYTRMIERARGAEARQVIGSLRTQAAALFLENGGDKMPLNTITNDTTGIGITDGLIPQDCTTATERDKYFFSYGIVQDGEYGFTATAKRCTTEDSKQPKSTFAGTLVLKSNFSNGTDVWSGTGGY